jgi:hypothetical protein
MLIGLVPVQVPVFARYAESLFNLLHVLIGLTLFEINLIHILIGLTQLFDFGSLGFVANSRTKKCNNIDRRLRATTPIYFEVDESKVRSWKDEPLST